MRTKEWYQKHLDAYFNKYFKVYNDNDDVEYFTDPAPNQWMFMIRYLDIVITLTCDDDGKVYQTCIPL